MPEITLKSENEHDFELLFSVDKNTFDALIDTLKSAEPGLSPEQISERFHESLKIDPDELKNITGVIYGITQIKLSSGLEPEKIVTDLLNSLQEFDNDLFSAEHCKDYLFDILNAEGSIFLTVAARDLAITRERILIDTDIETVVKPIFDDDKFKGLVVVHTLKIDFVENGKDDNTIYLALDKNDMDKLENLIQRAKLREVSLKTNISGTFVDF